MTAKEFLSQIRKCDNLINSKLAEIERLREFTTSITSTLKEDVVQSGGSPQRIADAIGKIVDLEREINADIDTYIALKKDIMDIIDTLDAPFCDLLYKRYFKYEKWEQIAFEMNYSYRQVTRMHGRALTMVNNALEEKRRPCLSHKPGDIL